MADGFGGDAGCGAPGREVRFELDSWGVVHTALWNNDRVWKLALDGPASAPEHNVYLPLVLKPQ